MRLATGVVGALASQPPLLNQMGRSLACVHRAPIRCSMAAAPGTMDLALKLRGGGADAALAAAAGASGAGGGLTAAIISPAATALGFMMWDSNWKGSAFSLNLVKNVIASIYFGLTLLLTGAIKPIFTPDVVLPVLSPLAFSALLGVVVGDCTAIASLRLLGSRRYLLIDCLKPALASAIGNTALRVTRP
mmetsp:Transcript_81161/g.230334  ORF Transcript_81161/g.230334 Transcript_81161/m.230334 type:complete len:190 (-) Transcript_81161:133-702(-)